MTQRELVYQKYNGKCAYTGTDLKDDWQIDHKEPKANGGANEFDNLLPAQRIVNHYKRGEPLEEFRTWKLGTFHEKLKRLPKNPKSKNGIKRKAYMLEIAELFGIATDKPFSGIFYFEVIDDESKPTISI